MKIVTELDITCNEGVNGSTECSDAITAALIEKYPIQDENGFRTGHHSILHEPHAHKIWIFLYDNDGVHESESNGKTIYQNTSKVKRSTKKPKDRDEIETELVQELMRNPNLQIK